MRERERERERERMKEREEPRLPKNLRYINSGEAFDEIRRANKSNRYFICNFTNTLNLKGLFKYNGKNIVILSSKFGDTYRILFLV